MDPPAAKAALLEAVDEARSGLRELPPGPAGQLFIAGDGTAVRPTAGLLRGDAALGIAVLDCMTGPAVARIAPDG